MMRLTTVTLLIVFLLTAVLIGCSNLTPLQDAMNEYCQMMEDEMVDSRHSAGSGNHPER